MEPAFVTLARSLGLTKDRLASMIDATKLSPTLTLEEARNLLDDVARHGFYCAMLPPTHALRLAREAAALGVRLCSVAGFPYGYGREEEKVSETRALASAGVVEVDAVVNLALVKSGAWSEVERELRILAKAAHEGGARLKLIVEAPLLSDEELDRLVAIAAKAGVDYLKTSTGVISKGGDPLTVARLTKAAEKFGLPVKAAGGIRSWYDAVAAVAAGASRIGASAYLEIIEGAPF